MAKQKKRKKHAASSSGAVPPPKAAVLRSKLAVQKSILPALALFSIVLATFLPTLRNGFISFDDGGYVTANAHVQAGFSWEGVRWAMGTTATGNWHPVTWLSHMLDCQFFGLRPWGHHLTSVLIHAVNSVLVLLIFRGMTGALWRSFFLAALFGLHPLRVESVAWAAERKDVLSVLFFLLTIWAYVGYAEREKGEGRREKGDQHFSLQRSTLYALALCFFALGLMSKPMLVTVPFVLLLIDYWPLGRFKFQSSEFKVQIARLLIEKVPFLALAVASSCITFIVQSHVGAVALLGQLSWLDRLENAIVAYCRYVEKLFLPLHLSIFYPHPGSWPAALVVFCYVALIVVSVVSIVWSRKRPYLLTGWLWFLGTLTPAIGFVQVGRQAMADRYTYIPSLGILLIVVWGAADLARYWLERQNGQPSQRGPTGQTAFATAGAVAIVLCAGLTIHQIGLWRDSETLFRHAAAVTKDNYLAHGNLGEALQEQGRINEAIQEYEEEVRIRPDVVAARNGLGVLLMQAGRWVEATNQLQVAVQQYREVLKWNPRNWNTRNSLGTALLSLGRVDEAASEFQQALIEAPDFAEAHNNLAFALRQQGRLDAAVEEYQRALRSKPDDLQIRGNLIGLLLKQSRHEEAISQMQEILKLTPGDVVTRKNLASQLVNVGRAKEAIEEFEKVLQMSLGDAETHRNLGLVLQAQGRMDEAIGHFRQAVALNPADAVSCNLLGYALEISRKVDEAIAMFEKALRIDPSLEAAHNNLGVALESKGRTDEAIAHFKQAIRLNPNSAEAHGSLGLTLAEAGRRDEAISELNEALKLRPDYQEAAMRLRELEAGAKNVQP